jgi:uncharacterized protein (AIM24 family)
MADLNLESSVSETESTFQILGSTEQVLNIRLTSHNDEKFSLLAEPQCLLHATPEITVSSSFDLSCFRAFGGESIVSTRYSTKGSGIVGLTSKEPGKIIPVDLKSLPGSRLHCRRGSWLATLGNAKVTSKMDCRVLTCCFGGQGLRQQQITGEGTVFLSGGGTILRRTMKKHERLVLDDHCLLAWTGTVEFVSKFASPSCIFWCLDSTGEGSFNFVVSGGREGGVIFIESFSHQRHRAAMLN